MNDSKLEETEDDLKFGTILESEDEEVPDFGVDELNLDQNLDLVAQQYELIQKKQAQALQKSQEKHQPLLKWRNLLPDGRVKKKILVLGKANEGCPKDGYEVHVHYEGLLKRNGFVFDSSRKRSSSPFNFVLGRQETIPGFEIAIKTMHKGEKATIVIHPSLAYGLEGLPPRIGPNETLQYEVELMDWIEKLDLSPNKDGSMIKKTIKAGSGFDRPSFNRMCTISFSIRSDPENVLLESANNVSFIVDSDSSILDGIHHCVKSMTQGEHAELFLDWKHGYGASPTHQKQNLHIEIELISFESLEHLSQMQPLAIIELVELKKKKANEALQRFKPDTALLLYNSILHEMLGHIEEHLEEPDLLERVLKLKTTVFSNIVLCHLQNKQWIKAENVASQLLLLDPKHSKGLYRRACARKEMEDLQGATRDLKALLVLEPNHPEVHSLLKQIQQMRKPLLQKESKVAKAMLGLSSSESKKPANWIELFVEGLFQPGVTPAHVTTFNVASLVLVVVLTLNILLDPSESSIHHYIFLTLAVALLLLLQWFLKALSEEKLKKN